ncbi:MAG: DUF4339 domain-containing protein [Variibacter sp.]|nr:DUF4339 domain-containing protein [Variibacter sp.]
MRLHRCWSVLLIAAMVLGLSAAGGAQPQLPGGQPRVGGPPPPPPPPQPPPTPPGVGLNEPMWVAVNGQPTGPFEPPVIFQKIAAREIIGETLVFTNSMNRWVRAADVAALQPALRQAQAGGGGGGGGMPPGPNPPPLPPSGGQEAIQRLEQFMLGEWMVEQPGMYQGITVRTQTRYLKDNTFVGFQVLVGQMGSGSTRPHNGRWSVQPIDDRRFMLTLTGAQLSGTVTLEIVDPNRLRNTQDNYISFRIGR